MWINIKEHFNLITYKKEQQEQLFENKHLSLWYSLNVVQSL